MTDQYELYLDIETMDTSPRAKVWEIAAIIINPDKKLTSFTCLINWESYKGLSAFSESKATCEWIENHINVYNRWRAAQVEGLDICDAFNELEIFLENELEESRFDRDKLTAYSWGKFDLPILNHAMNFFNFNPVCHYGSECDLRSVTKFLKSTIRPDTSDHIALSDAHALVEAVSELKSTMPLLRGK